MTAETKSFVHSDALRTVAVNGAYNASRALSKWLHRGVRLNTDGFRMVPITNVASTVCGEDETVAAVHLPLDGDLDGHLLLVFPEKVGLALSDMMMQLPVGTSKAFTDLEESCLCETGNIVGSSYANSLAKWLELSIEPSVPTFACDMASSILDPLLMEQAMSHDEVLMASTEFLLDGDRVEWSLLLLPTNDSLAKMESRCHAETARREALQTIAINGAFNASRAMSKWLKKGVKLDTDGFSRVSLNDVTAQFDENEPIIALVMDLQEQMHGFAVLAMQETDARCLVDLLMQQSPGTTKEFGEIERSCLEETGNIISGSYVNSWSTWLEIEIEPYVPQFVNDLPGAILQGVLAEQALVGDEAFMARTNFFINDQSLEWLFMLLPSPSAMRLIETSCK
ncbi:MAG: chemotaxis protein CheC [Phycisphaerae bacterium]